MDGNKIEHKIANLSALILTFGAALADLASLIPFVGTVVGPIFWIAVSIYFWTIGMGIISGRRLATGLISAVAELIPGVQALPTITVGIIAVILMTRIEEKTGISVSSLTKRTPGVTPPRLKPPKLNAEQGIRYPNKN